MRLSGRIRRRCFANVVFPEHVAPLQHELAWIPSASYIEADEQSDQQTFLCARYCAVKKSNSEESCSGSPVRRWYSESKHVPLSWTALLPEDGAHRTLGEICVNGRSAGRDTPLGSLDLTVYSWKHLNRSLNPTFNATVYHSSISLSGQLYQGSISDPSPPS
ncbi:hypothetical protein OE88DRAFT_1129422 [Heliocybe sulcata]|uniref:Uncharacterized protein n=1 Tax=Heliocybe sulcata TaxID=5364 RepID=A0A5C3NAK4_9AGAM|nr:hypothetical protein OE88DRAFT_1129422 [Heliocybe sulcata]